MRNGSGGKKVLLVDDHEMVRRGLRLLLETAFDHTVFEASCADEALSIAGMTDLDLVLLDARLPQHDGIWILKRLSAKKPDLPVIMLSTYQTDDYINDALDAGACGYVLKDSSIDQLRDAITTALDGEGLYLHPSVTHIALARERRLRANRLENDLTERELEVLHLVVEGATNQEIADRLFVSEKTVKAHVSSIFRKLMVANRTQAVARALSHRLVSA